MRHFALLLAVVVLAAFMVGAVYVFVPGSMPAEWPQK